MLRYLTHENGTFWRAEVEEDVIVIKTGAIGEEGELHSVVESWDHGMPPEYFIDTLVEPVIENGFTFAPIPDVHLQIEKHHGPLPEPIRSFFAEGTYLEHQGKRCERLKCDVDFTDDSVLGNYMQEHYDRPTDTHLTFVPISGRIINGAPDEQSWIGINPAETDGPVYALYTSGEFDKEWDSLAEFLADLT